MASVLDTAELIDSEDQTAFNLAVWKKVLADRFLAASRIALKRIVMGKLSCRLYPIPSTAKNKLKSAPCLKNCCRMGM